jgi:hypothetical protein
VGPVAPVVPVAPVGPVGAVAPPAPVAPVGAVGPVAATSGLDRDLVAGALGAAPIAVPPVAAMEVEALFCVVAAGDGW